VHDGDGGGAGVAEQHRQRHAHDVGVAHDGHALAAHPHPAAAQQLHAAQRGAGHEARGAAAHQGAPHIERVEAVHVLAGVEAVDDGLLVDVRRQRQLHQHPVHKGVLAERAHRGAQRRLRCRRGQAHHARRHAHALAGLPLAGDIEGGVGAVPHKHHPQPRGAAPGGAEGGHLRGELLLPRRRHGAAGQQGGAVRCGGGVGG
jgi:hypothetical protein